MPSSDAITVRAATEADASALAAIYAPYVTDTAISFDESPPDAEEMWARVERSHDWLVAEADGVVLGYAYAGPFHGRAAYRWSVEVSIYLAADARRRGIGSRLLDELLARVREAGFVQAFAGIALPNPASQGLFESRGFRAAARYDAVGYKGGAWHDVGWWQLQLTEPTASPAPPRAPRRTS